jgi:hypothetical protein
LLRQAQLADHDDVKWRMESSSDLEGDRDATARDPKDEQVRAAGV